MAQKPIGKVVSIIKMFSENGVVLNLTDSLSVGDRVTFDGWQEGLSTVVEKLTQSHKNVTTAVPGTASIFVSSSMFIAPGSGIYKITEEQPAQGGQTAGTNAPSQGQQGPEVIPVAFGAGVAGSAQQPQGQAPNSKGNQQAQQSSGAVASNIGIGGLLNRNFYANNAALISTSNAAQLINLPATATEFLKYTPSYATEIKSKTMSYRLWYALIGVVLILPILVLSFSYGKPPTSLILITFSAEFLISGAILLYLGFKDFSLEQFLQSIPAVKIDVATYNLNKMQGKFMPYNAEPLKAPISGAECVYYSVELYLETNDANGQVVMQWIGGMGKGVPTLFSDDSGYLAVELMKAPNVQVTSSAFGVNKVGFGAPVVRKLSGPFAYVEQGNEAAAEIMPHIEEAANSNSTVDLSQISDFKFNLLFKNRIRDIKEGITPNEMHMKALQSFRLFLVEQYIPANSEYTCLGGAADISKSIDGKPVKVMVPDQDRGTMAVYAGAAQNVKRGMSKRILLNMAIGILFIIVALGLLSLYFGSASATSVAKVTTNAATSIVTTVVPS